MSNGTVVSIDGHRLTLTNLSKVMYRATGTTKADVLAYERGADSRTLVLGWIIEVNPQHLIIGEVLHCPLPGRDSLPLLAIKEVRVQHVALLPGGARGQSGGANHRYESTSRGYSVVSNGLTLGGEDHDSSSYPSRQVLCHRST